MGENGVDRYFHINRDDGQKLFNRIDLWYFKMTNMLCLKLCPENPLNPYICWLFNKLIYDAKKQTLPACDPVLGFLCQQHFPKSQNQRHHPHP